MGRDPKTLRIGLGSLCCCWFGFPRISETLANVRALWKGAGLSWQRPAVHGYQMPGMDQPGL